MKLLGVTQRDSRSTPLMLSQLTSILIKILKLHYDAKSSRKVGESRERARTIREDSKSMTSRDGLSHASAELPMINIVFRVDCEIPRDSLAPRSCLCASPASVSSRARSQMMEQAALIMRRY